MCLAFDVVPYKQQIEKGWKLASIQDVHGSLVQAKLTLLREKEWCICKLKDGSMKGSGYGFTIDQYYNKGWSSKMIVKIGG